MEYDICFIKNKILSVGILVCGLQVCQSTLSLANLRNILEVTNYTWKVDEDLHYRLRDMYHLS
jgi:hypothetical protein